MKHHQRRARATIRLERRLEIALWYGPTGQTPTVPRSYRFPAGL